MVVNGWLLFRVVCYVGFCFWVVIGYCGVNSVDLLLHYFVIGLLVVLRLVC